MQLGAFTGPGSQRALRGRRVGHVLAGDFNHLSWENGYREWVGTHGARELSDPALGTYGSGNALDKFLFAPGFYFPSTFLPPETIRADRGGGGG